MQHHVILFRFEQVDNNQGIAPRESTGGFVDTLEHKTSYLDAETQKKM